MSGVNVAAKNVNICPYMEGGGRNKLDVVYEWSLKNSIILNNFFYFRNRHYFGLR